MGIFAFHNWGSGEKRQKCCPDLVQHHCFTSPLLNVQDHSASSAASTPPNHASALKVGASYESLYFQHGGAGGTMTPGTYDSRSSHTPSVPQQLNLYYKPFFQRRQEEAEEQTGLMSNMNTVAPTCWNDSNVLHLIQGTANSSSSRSGGFTRTSDVVNPSSCNSSYEHLFYKVVTPSDVGKLNRLVIPKQHAERWFPLDPCLRKKGRLLSFQDVVSRELWWFRYSYWSSSQSYVLTKGWIRFVKEKDLQAGDIISFERGERHQLYINCRKRPTSSRSLASGTKVHFGSSSLHQDSPSTAQLKPAKQLFPSNASSDDEEEGEEEEEEEVLEAPVTGTRLFGVDLRATPILQHLQGSK